ncbi:Riboflavin synthase-like beta-barrel [Penicillium griseofulvum]|uniref:NADH-cytochrome b5 reductase n=1 Tax=Penicillium patulum TaxID=5078 RepID=A0A135LF59_PENPA|nr:Riboflavin synthase-like beta-barrel [Penicillium griseofulvum]KXG47616.1 Riboflavin synthase-like beta-barrel [Penicillium griseofulvum]
MFTTRFTQSITAKSAAAVTLLGIGGYCAQTRLISTAHAESKETYKVFSGFGFTTLRLQSIKDFNHNTKRLVFEFPDQNATSGLSLTSALLTISRPEGRWLPVLRPYTPISDLDQKGQIELMVKKYPNGKASTHIHSLVPGDTLTFAAAIQGHAWTPNQSSQVYLIAGGAGITPIYQLAQGILNNPADQTKIKLVFGVNTEQDLLLREELEGFKTRFPDRFDYLYTVSHPEGQSDGFRKGYVTEELLRDVVKADEDAKVFVCGPPAMEDSLVGSKFQSGILAKLGFEKGQIVKF